MPFQTVSEIEKALKEPQNKSLIAKAQAHELRLRFHGETALSQADASRAVTDFLQWVRTLLSAEDKYHIFCWLFSFPVGTAELSDQIYSALEKVFDGRNPVFKYDFRSPEAESDWLNYRTERLKSPDCWRYKGMEAMRTAINSVLIVDLPAAQSTANPEPYFYWLDINNVVDFSLQEGDRLEWIAFKAAPERLAVFCDGFYRSFSIKEGTTDIIELLTESPHDLGYCPARFFWSASTSRKHPALKKSPISNQLGDLDWLLYFMISKRHLDLYAAYPIYSGFAQDCDFEDEEAGTHCDGGYLKNVADGRYLINRHGSGSVLHPCPACSRKRLAGPGSFVEVAPPGPDNDKADLRNPVQILTINRESLQYNVEEVERLKRVIYQSVTGYGGEPMNDQAVNEKQIVASFESRTQVLRQLKKNFESAHQWVDETICRLRYGGAFISASINYGTEFYLYAPEVLLEMYTTAKKDGADLTTLDMLQDQYFETKYRNNPEQLTRMRVLKHLDPFRHLTRQEVREMAAAGEVAREDALVKANFSSLIMRFERENTDVVTFGSGIDFDRKIQAIQDELRKYVMPAAPAEVVPAAEPQIQE